MTRRAKATGLAIIASVLLLAVYRSPVDRGFRSADLRGTRTEAEVGSLLGPAGDYSTGGRVYGFAPHTGPLPKGRQVVWQDDRARIVAYFSPDGDLNYWNVHPAIGTRSWADRLWDHLREQGG